ncbi:MAG: cell wall hydrolase, partial [Alphaproteobacteria bacterium]
KDHKSKKHTPPLSESLIAVCLQADHFTCWDKDYRHQDMMLVLNSDDRHYQLCQRIAKRALKGALDHQIGNHHIGKATHFHRNDNLPLWAKGKQAICEISHYWFYHNPVNAIKA